MSMLQKFPIKKKKITAPLVRRPWHLAANSSAFLPSRAATPIPAPFCRRGYRRQFLRLFAVVNNAANSSVLSPSRTAPPFLAPFRRREQHFRVNNCSLPYIWGSCRGNDRVNTDYQKLRLFLSPFLFPVFCACVVALSAWVFFYSSFNVLYLGAHALLGKIMNTNLESRSFTSPALLTLTSPECLMLDSNAKVQQSVAREATSTRMWDCNLSMLFLRRGSAEYIFFVYTTMHKS